MLTLAMVLTGIGVPTEGLALVLGVDRLLDMFRTATNVVGDSSVTVMMSRLEGDDIRFLSKEEDAANPKKGFEARVPDDANPVEPEVKDSDDVAESDAGTSDSESPEPGRSQKDAGASPDAAEEE